MKTVCPGRDSISISPSWRFTRWRTGSSSTVRMAGFVIDHLNIVTADRGEHPFSARAFRGVSGSTFHPGRCAPSPEGGYDRMSCGRKHETKTVPGSPDRIFFRDLLLFIIRLSQLRRLFEGWNSHYHKFRGLFKHQRGQPLVHRVCSRVQRARCGCVGRQSAWLILVELISTADPPGRVFNQGGWITPNKQLRQRLIPLTTLTTLDCFGNRLPPHLLRE